MSPPAFCNVITLNTGYESTGIGINHTYKSTKNFLKQALFINNSEYTIVKQKPWQSSASEPESLLSRYPVDMLLKRKGESQGGQTKERVLWDNYKTPFGKFTW